MRKLVFFVVNNSYQRDVDNGSHSFKLGSIESEAYENCERYGKSNTGRLSRYVLPKTDHIYGFILSDTLVIFFFI